MSSELSWGSGNLESSDITGSGFILFRLILDLTISYPAGAGPESEFGENLFWDHRTIHLMKLMASSMLTAATKRQYNSMLPLLGHCLPVFDETCGMATNFVFKIKIANTPLGRSATLVLPKAIIN